MAGPESTERANVPTDSFFNEGLPPDPLFGINAACTADTRKNKVNGVLGVGRLEGIPHIFPAVREALRRVDQRRKSAEYLPIAGNPEFLEKARELLLPRMFSAPTASIGTPGGTGAIRAGLQFLKRGFGGGQRDTIFAGKRPRFFISDQTWPNWPAMIRDTFPIQDVLTSYRHVRSPSHDPQQTTFDTDAFLGSTCPPDELPVFVLHAVCHNPTGVDPSADQWKTIANKIKEVGGIAFIDIAYQGFGESFEKDAQAIRILREAQVPMLIAQSFSKNLSLYNERVGALHIPSFSKDDTPAGKADAEKKAHVYQSHLNNIARIMWSNPSATGELVAAEVLGDEALRREWLTHDLQEVYDQVQKNRRVFESVLGNGATGRKGLFDNPFVGIPLREGCNVANAVKELREKFAIYLAPNGRINLGGISEEQTHNVAEIVRDNYKREG